MAWVDKDDEYDHLKPCLQAEKIIFWRAKTPIQQHTGDLDVLESTSVTEKYTQKFCIPPEALAEQRLKEEARLLAQRRAEGPCQLLRSLIFGRANAQQQEQQQAGDRATNPIATFTHKERHSDRADRDEAFTNSMGDTAKLGDRLGLIRPRLCIRLQRDPSFFLMNVSLPMFAVILLCLSTFYLGYNNVELRVEAILISALAAAAHRSAIGDQIPLKTYFMYGDAYFLAIYGYLAIFCVKVILVYQGLNSDGVGFFYFDGEVDDDGDKFSKKQQVYQTLDDAASSFLLVLWFVAHGVLFRDLLSHDDQNFVRRYLHPKWEEKMILAAKLCKSDVYHYGYNDILHPGKLEEPQPDPDLPDSDPPMQA